MAEMVYTQAQLEAMIMIAVKTAMASSAAMAQTQVLNQVNQQPVEEKHETPLFKDYAKQWQELYHNPRTGDRWRVESGRLLNNRILPYMGEMHLDEITVDVLQNFFNTLSKLSESTNLHVKHMIGGILQSAVEDDIIVKNPAKSKRLTLSKKKTERKPLELDEVQEVLSNMDKLDGTEKLLLALLLYTGMRRGEVMALRWQDVDLESNLIHVRHSVNLYDGNHAKLKEPKSKAGFRNIPISDQLLPFLENGGNPDVFVLTGTVEPITAHGYAWLFNGIRKKVDLHGATSHALRHTFATLSSERLDPKTLQAIMGHSTIDMTLNRYTHAQKRLIDEAGSKLSGMYRRDGDA